LKSTLELHSLFLLKLESLKWASRAVLLDDGRQDSLQWGHPGPWSSYPNHTWLTQQISAEPTSNQYILPADACLKASVNICFEPLYYAMVLSVAKINCLQCRSFYLLALCLSGDTGFKVYALNQNTKIFWDPREDASSKTSLTQIFCAII
jgi:hypothetical protein